MSARITLHVVVNEDGTVEPTVDFMSAQRFDGSQPNSQVSLQTAIETTWALDRIVDYARELEEAAKARVERRQNPRKTELGSLRPAGWSSYKPPRPGGKL